MSKLSILVDGAHAFSKAATGISTYRRSLVTALRSCDCTVQVLFGRRAARSDHGNLAYADQVFGDQVPQRWMTDRTRFTFRMLRAVLGLGKEERGLPLSTEMLKLSALDPPLFSYDQAYNLNAAFEFADWYFNWTNRLLEIHAPGSSVAHWTGPMPLRAKGLPNIYTLHDVIPLEYPYFVHDPGARMAKLHEKIANTADHIITVSESSKKSIVRLLSLPEERVSVTYQPASRVAALDREDAERLVRNVYKLKPNEYIFFAGAIEPKKNLQRLCEAYLMSGLDIPLVLAGPLGWMYEDLLDFIRRIVSFDGGLELDRDGFSAKPRFIRSKRDKIQRLGYLPRRDLIALMQCARCFVFPSVVEGFGLPILEAMQLGTPVLTSTDGALLEVAGDAALAVDPLSVTAIRDGIRTIADDQDLRTDLSKRGHSRVAFFNEADYKKRLASAYGKVGVAFPSEA